MQEACRGLRACAVGVLEEGAELRMLLQSCIAVGNALRLGRLCRGVARTGRGTCTNVKKVTGSRHITDRTSHNSLDVLSSKTANSSAQSVQSLQSARSPLHRSGRLMLVSVRIH